MQESDASCSCCSAGHSTEWGHLQWRWAREVMWCSAVHFSPAVVLMPGTTPLPACSFRRTVRPAHPACLLVWECNHWWLCPLAHLIRKDRWQVVVWRFKKPSRTVAEAGRPLHCLCDLTLSLSLWPPLWNKCVLHKRFLSALLKDGGAAVACCSYYRLPRGRLQRWTSKFIQRDFLEFGIESSWRKWFQTVFQQQLDLLVRAQLKRKVCMAPIPCQHV